MGEIAGPLQPVVAAAAAGCSPARVRQLTWVGGELTRYAAGLAARKRPAVQADWFTPAFVDAYLDAAASGMLRVRSRRSGTAPTPVRPAPGNATGAKPSGPASMRVRVDCVRLLAAAAGRSPAQLSGLGRPAAPLPPDAPDSAAVRAMVALLASEARDRNCPDMHVRDAAMLLLTYRHRLRTSELAALWVTDLDLSAGVLRTTARPPGGRAGHAPRRVPLDADTRRVLTEWLRRRESLTAAVPRCRELFVSVHPNHDGSGVRRPAGMPLRENGLRRAYARASRRVNEQLAAQPGRYLAPATLRELAR